MKALLYKFHIFLKIIVHANCKFNQQCIILFIHILTLDAMFFSFALIKISDILTLNVFEQSSINLKIINILLLKHIFRS